MRHPCTIALRMLAVVGLAIASSCTPETINHPPGPVVEINPVWRAPVSEASPSFPSVITDGEYLYTQVGGVSAYDIGTGMRLWITRGVRSAPRNIVVSEGSISEAESIARSLDPVSGVERWRFAPDTTADFAFSDADERAFYIGTRSSTVYALDLATGRPFWTASPLEEVRYVAHVQAIIVHGDTVYVAIEEDTSPTGHLLRGWIVALDRYTGEIFWRFVNERAGEPHDASYPTIAGRILLVNDRRGGAFFGIDRFTGEEVWRYTGPSDRYGGADFFSVAGGIAYLASLDAYAYAVDPETGRILWKTDVQGSAHSSAVCGEHLYVGAGVLYKLRRSDGEVESIYLVDELGFAGNEFVTSRLLAYEGRLYFVTNRAIYAVECG